jgi:hypothetical protein
MRRLPEKYLVTGILLLLVVVYGILALLSEGSVGGTDDMTHYRYARYAFHYPRFLVHHWAKPFYTAVVAPFAQLGPHGIRIFNVLAGTAAAYLTYLMARQLSFRDPVLAIFLLISSPLYTVLMLSGMTEILFSLMLVASILLFYRKRHGWAALILSFIPFVRTEGAVILPLFLVAFALERSWRSIPLLLVGTLFYSFAGSFYHDDLLWVVRKMPYHGGARDIYGHGSLFHYAGAAKYIFGIPLAMLILIGLAVWLTDLLRNREQPGRKLVIEMLVVYMPFLAYFTAHSFVWWKGLGNSVGLIRVMGAILPSAALLGMLAWSRIVSLIPVRERWKQLFSWVLALYLVTLPYGMYQIPVPLSQTQKLVKQASEWFVDSPYFQHKIYYYDPYFCHFIGLDPFDEARVKAKVYSTRFPEKKINAGEVVIWDAHFGPNEGNLPLEKLMDNPGFRLVYLVRPDKPFQVLGGYDYEIYFFQRIAEDEGADNYQLRNQLLIPNS